ncbi:MAG: tripartite tricarboxylate transporter substrate binding protein [Betaproteobacteria bacterium]|nr:tripartite tricarboxylate transporter substrate binding protein [Betaproteobacteria bacterium]MDH5222805.1 tripartite tricarboxylate transporter substrate binding protein [Betaproteobacteria bacterium]MDH5350239.1 tripartite tricarboxylate transporter substrate binding protein [Betaproteobacteria bacterium]
MKKIIAAITALLALGAQAQEYPTRPITMIVPFPPGGVADIVGRPLAASMEKTLGQPIVVVNRPGAGGAVGMTAAAKADPDGYTVLMALSSISIFPVSDPLQGRAAPYQISDFVPIALVTADPTVLVVSASSPYKTVADFVAYAKANPGKINYSSSGIFGTLHVAMEMFAGSAGIKLFHVPYQGGGPAVRALLSGEVQALASGPAAAVGQIQAGKMRALAGWGAKRLDLMPELPTFKELGYKDVEFYIWSGVVAPAATPAAAQHKLRAAVRAAVADPQFAGAMAKVRTPLNYLDAPEFQTFWHEDAKRLSAAVHKIGKAAGK